MKINYTVKFLICTFIVLTFCGGASAVIAAQISGTVYDSVGSLISDGGTVYAYTGNPCEAIEWGMPTGIGTIGADGTFSITEDWMGGSLPAGDYYLYAYPSGNYFSEWWTDSGSVPDCSQAQVVSVAADETATGKDFQLNFGARISGNVYDSSGTPITTGSVTAYTGDPCDIYYSAGSGYINSDGSYTIQKLTAGDYYLRADSSNAQYPEWWAEPESSPDCNQAQAVTVTAGETVTHKDFQLDLGAQITGTVYYSAGNPVSDSWEVVAVAGDPCGAYSTVKYAWTDMMDGTYSLGGLPPGSYYLGSRFMSSDVSQWWTESGSSPECAQAQLVTVASEDSLNSMDFELDNGAQISGIVYESDGTTLVNYGYVYAYANTSGDPCMGMWDYAGSGYINSDGTYTIVGLAAGNYYLQADSGNYYSEWWADPASTQDCSQAQTVTVGAFETVTGRDFQLDTAPSISGRLYDSAGNPITYTDAYVELYTGDPCESSNYPVNSGGIDWESGTYTVRGVSPGEYFLKANAYGNYVSEWWADPASSSDCTQAQVVTMEAGETVTGKNFQLDAISTTYTVTTLVDPPGSGTVDGGDTYIVGATATLTANPGAGYVFTGWSGDVTGTENPVQIVVYSDKTITANFALMNTITLTADASGNGSGTVSSDVGGINYAYPAANTATTTPLNLGSSITLTATAETGSTASWMGCASTGGTTTAATCSFASLDANTTVTAIFTLNTHTVTTLADPVEGGTVDGGGIFNWGETATLTANPAVGYAFSGWSGSITGMENPVQVTVDSDKTITANFILLPFYTVSTSANPLDGGSVIGGGSYYEGSTAILTANPAAGYVFTGWSGDVSGMENPIQVQVNSDKTITANFTLAAAYTVTASANPSEGGAVDGGGSYNAGDTATLTAIPAEGYVFIGWSGDATGIDNPLSVAVDSDMNITANFKKKGKLTFPIRAKDGQIVIISL